MNRVQQGKSRKRGIVRNRKITNPFHGLSHVPREYILNTDAIKDCERALTLLAKRS